MKMNSPSKKQRQLRKGDALESSSEKLSDAAEQDASTAPVEKDFDNIINLLKNVEGKSGKIDEEAQRIDNCLNEKLSSDPECQMTEAKLQEKQNIELHLQKEDVLISRKLSDKTPFAERKPKCERDEERHRKRETGFIAVLQKRIEVLEFQASSFRTFQELVPSSDVGRLLQERLLLQKQLKKKAKEVAERDLLIRLKDRELRDMTEKNSNSDSNLVYTLMHNTKKIRSQERQIRTLREQLKFSESLVSAYREKASFIKCNACLT